MLSIKIFDKRLMSYSAYYVRHEKLHAIAVFSKKNKIVV